MKRDLFDIILGLLWWVALLYGFMAHDPWTFAVGAFFIVLDKLDER